MRRRAAYRQGARLPARPRSSSTTPTASPTTSPRTRCVAQGMQVDRAGFDTAMAEQKAKARAAWKGSGAKASEDIWFDLVEQYGATEFTGYSGDEGEGVVLAIVKDGERVENAEVGETVEILLNQTPFYGESGGQIGDTGKLTTLKGFVGEVEDTSKPLGKLHVLAHEGRRRAS